jgi:hypothetical protein
LVQPAQSELLLQSLLASVPQVPAHDPLVQVVPAQLGSWQSVSLVQALLPSVPQLPDSQVPFPQVTCMLGQPEQSELEPQSMLASVPQPPSLAPQDPLMQVFPVQDES